MKFTYHLIILCYLVVPLLAESPVERAARLSVMEEEVAKAEKDGMPTGFLDAKWFMIPEEIQKVRPKVSKFEDLVYGESLEHLGRRAEVKYCFSAPGKFLIMVLISFTENSTSDDYQATRKTLVEKFGEFPQPMPSARFELDSRLKRGRMAIGHVWKMKAGFGSEQILIYRTEQ